MTSHFVDSSVFLFAVGIDDPRRDPARQFLEMAEAAGEAIHVSVEAVQEFAFHRLRRVDRTTALTETASMTESVVLHPFDLAVMDGMLRLLATTTTRGRDAVHAATALAAGFTTIVSFDADFDAVPGLRRLHPQ